LTPSFRKPHVYPPKNKPEDAFENTAITRFIKNTNLLTNVRLEKREERGERRREREREREKERERGARDERKKSIRLGYGKGRN
jgi:hypothetical protein